MDMSLFWIGIPIFSPIFNTTSSVWSRSIGVEGRGIPRISRQSLLVYCSRSLRDFMRNFTSFEDLSICALRLAFTKSVYPSLRRGLSVF